MNINEKEKVLNYLENNLDNIKINIHNRIDFLKIGADLGFDINEAYYKNHGINTFAITIIDETKEVINGQKSNKLLIYNSNLQQIEKDFIIAYAVVSYILNKEINKIKPLKMSNVYTKNYLDENISELATTFLNPETFINSKITIIPKTKTILKPATQSTRMTSEKILLNNSSEENKYLKTLNKKFKTNLKH